MLLDAPGITTFQEFWTRNYGYFWAHPGTNRLLDFSTLQLDCQTRVDTARRSSTRPITVLRGSQNGAPTCGLNRGLPFLDQQRRAAITPPPIPRFRLRVRFLSVRSSCDVARTRVHCFARFQLVRKVHSAERLGLRTFEARSSQPFGFRELERS